MNLYIIFEAYENSALLFVVFLSLLSMVHLILLVVSKVMWTRHFECAARNTISVISEGILYLQRHIKRLEQV